MPQKIVNSRTAQASLSIDKNFAPGVLLFAQYGQTDVRKIRQAICARFADRQFVARDKTGRSAAVGLASSTLFRLEIFARQHVRGVAGSQAVFDLVEPFVLFVDFLSELFSTFVSGLKV